MTNTELTATAAYLLDIIAACQNDDWAPLATVRTESGLTREAADTALRELHNAHLVRIEVDPVAYARSNAYRAAAIVIGGEACHVASVTYR